MSSGTFRFQIIPVLLQLVQAVSSVRLYIPKDLRPQDARQNVGKSIQVILYYIFVFSSSY